MGSFLKMLLNVYHKIKNATIRTQYNPIQLICLNQFIINVDTLDCLDCLR